MIHCMNYDPRKRPFFRAIVRDIEMLEEQSGGKFSFSMYLEMAVLVSPRLISATESYFCFLPFPLVTILNTPPCDCQEYCSYLKLYLPKQAEQQQPKPLCMFNCLFLYSTFYGGNLLL